MEKTVERIAGRLPLADVLVSTSSDAGDEASDEDALHQMFENLIRNSAEHDASRATFGALPDGAGFYFEDDGEGIPDEEREKVFEHGYSTQGTTGFGLSIVRAIVEAHGWTIHVAEGSEDDARFEVEFV